MQVGRRRAHTAWSRVGRHTTSDEPWYLSEQPPHMHMCTVPWPRPHPCGGPAKSIFTRPGLGAQPGRALMLLLLLLHGRRRSWAWARTAGGAQVCVACRGGRWETRVGNKAVPSVRAVRQAFGRARRMQPWWRRPRLGPGRALRQSRPASARQRVGAAPLIGRPRPVAIFSCTSARETPRICGRCTACCHVLPCNRRPPASASALPIKRMPRVPSPAAAAACF